MLVLEKKRIHSNLDPEDNVHGVFEAENPKDRIFKRRMEEYLTMLARAIIMLTTLGRKVIHR
jgi:hypothetical protein